MKPKHLLASAALLVALPAFPSGYDKPYVIVEPARPQPTREVVAPRILSIDGESVGRVCCTPLEPGPHVIGLSVPGPTRYSQLARRTIVIDAAPCTRYAIGARKPSHTSRQWDVFVEREEKIGECAWKFQRAAL